MINPNWNDLIFRLLFSSIFAGLGAEHLIDDRMIMHLMPEWIPEPRLISIISGLILLSGATLIILGYKLKIAALILGGFLTTVTLSVHLPALFSVPQNLPKEWDWTWIILQRSNFVKNICLLGVCFLITNYTPHKFSLDSYLNRKNLKK